MFAAFFLLLCSVIPSHAEYHLEEHCGDRWRYNVFEILDMADTILIARVADDARYSEEKWHEAEFQIQEVLLGTLRKGTKETLFADIGGEVSGKRLQEVFRRADLHDSPEFFPLYFTWFPVFGYAALPGEEACFPVPTVMKNIPYAFVLSGRKVLSAEPVLTQTDYWLRFLKALKKMHYWKRRQTREEAAGAED